MVRARRILVTGLALVTVSIAIAGLFVVKFSGDATTARAGVLRSLEMGRALQAVSAGLVDAETGQRGYILTERGDYLTPYETAVKTLPGAMAAFRSSIRRDPDSEQRLATLDSLVQEKLAELASTIDASRSKGFDAARRMVLTDAGKSVMERIRNTIGELAADENGVLSAGLAARASNNRATITAAIAAVVLVMASLAGGVWLLIASLRRIERTDTALRDQGMLLQATLDSIRDGVAAFDGSGRRGRWLR